MKIKFIARALLTAFFALILGASTSHAQDIPILTWERGKEQNIVLGGNTAQLNWKIYLVNEKGSQSLPFSTSVPNAKGFIVYTIFISNSEPIGAYHLIAKGKDGTSTVVSGVQITERKYFRITQIPTDLRLLFIIYALFTSTFSIIRGRRYSFLAFPRYRRHSINQDALTKYQEPKVLPFLNIFYNFRVRRQLGMDLSFLRFVTLRDGEPLHKISANVWSILPLITFLFGTFEATVMQGRKVIPHMPLAFYIALAILGAIDAASGFTALIGFAIVQIFFGDINSMRAILTLFTFAMPWFAPSMLASIYYLTLRIDYFDYLRRLGNRAKMGLTLLFSSLFGASAVVFAVVLMESLTINQPASAFLRWPLSLIVFAVLLVKNLLNELVDMRVLKSNSSVEMEVESIYVARVMSPSFALMLGIAGIGLVYVWTQQLVPSLITALLLVIPYLALFISLPEFAGRRLPTFPRNITIEAILMALLTGIIFFAVEKLPFANFAKSKAFILLGVIPLVFHSLYSLIVDSSERAKRKAVDTTDIGGVNA